MARRGASAQPLWAYRVLRAYNLEANLEAGIGRERLGWHDRSWIRESRHRGDVKVGAVDSVVLVEDVVDDAVYLHILRQAVGCVHTDNSVSRQPGVQVGLITEEHLVAGGDKAGACTPLCGEPVVDACLQ